MNEQLEVLVEAAVDARAELREKLARRIAARRMRELADKKAESGLVSV